MATVLERLMSFPASSSGERFEDDEIEDDERRGAHGRRSMVA
jgi:hypothetical protein